MMLKRKHGLEDLDLSLTSSRQVTIEVNEVQGEEEEDETKVSFSNSVLISSLFLYTD